MGINNVIRSGVENAIWAGKPYGNIRLALISGYREFRDFLTNFIWEVKRQFLAISVFNIPKVCHFLLFSRFRKGTLYDGTKGRCIWNPGGMMQANVFAITQTAQALRANFPTMDNILPDK